jgi:hypothetical protein
VLARHTALFFTQRCHAHGARKRARRIERSARSRHEVPRQTCSLELRDSPKWPTQRQTTSNENAATSETMQRKNTQPPGPMAIAAKRSSAASAPSSTGHQRSSVSVMAHHTPPTKDAGGVSCMVLVARQRDRSPWSCSGYAQSPSLEAAPYLSTPPQTRRHTPLVTVRVSVCVEAAAHGGTRRGVRVVTQEEEG